MKPSGFRNLNGAESFPWLVRAVTHARMGWGGTMLLLAGSVALAVGAGMRLFGAESTRSNSAFPLGWGAFAASFGAILILSFLRKPFAGIVETPNDRGATSGGPIPPEARPDVRVIVEGTTCEQDGDKWIVKVYVTVFNNEPFGIVLFDAHLHRFEFREIRMPYMSMAGGPERDIISILRTNSILEGGRTYRIGPVDYRPFELRSQVSVQSRGIRTEAVFGLYVDFHTDQRGETRSIQAPSESVVVFEPSEAKPSLGHVNSEMVDRLKGGPWFQQAGAFFMHSTLKSHLARWRSISGTATKEQASGNVKRTA